MDLSVVTVGINLNKWNKVFAGLGRLTRDIAALLFRRKMAAVMELFCFYRKFTRE